MNRRNQSIGSLMKQAFDKVLPIPKTPRLYRPPPPPKPLTWIPHGSIGQIRYEMRLRDFATEIRVMDSQRTKRFKYSSRGWCYLLEGLGKIHKGEFVACQKAINDCRKIGLLPINFVASDQDVTRHISGIHEASNPTAPLKRLKADVAEMLEKLPSYSTDYWTDEEYYVMMCVEKGDILNLFKPICKEYHVPVVSSKGWSPISLRSDIAKLGQEAEVDGLAPVMLLFYDHDPGGMKISNRFRKNLMDCARGTGWQPYGLIIDRFGLNKEDIDKYDLTWIDNLKTSSGRESTDWKYRNEYGRRKCEVNALFKNDETLAAAEEICRAAIEKYYGTDAKARFGAKEEKVKEEKLGGVYDNPIWEDFKEKVDGLIESFEESDQDDEEDPVTPATGEEEIAVVLDDGYYGRCPRCRRSFNYDVGDLDRLVRCRVCRQPMRLKMSKDEEE